MHAKYENNYIEQKKYHAKVKISEKFVSKNVNYLWIRLEELGLQSVGGQSVFYTIVWNQVFFLHFHYLFNHF